MPRKFQVVGVGGTFDELHKGHRALLTKAFEVGERVIVGLSSDGFARRMGKPHVTAPYQERFEELQAFLKNNGLLTRADIVDIHDPYGGVLLTRSSIEALIVSRETEAMGNKINEKRERLGLKPLDIITVDMIPSDNNTPISTTRIRRGEIDREGHAVRSEVA